MFYDIINKSFVGLRSISLAFRHFDDFPCHFDGFLRSFDDFPRKFADLSRQQRRITRETIKMTREIIKMTKNERNRTEIHKTFVDNIIAPRMFFELANNPARLLECDPAGC